MWRRLKNLWAWSDIKPTPAGFKWNGWVEPELTTEKGFNVGTMIENQFSSRSAQIIYPDRKKEVLRSKEEPSIDDLLSE